jgi:hypothetical protein
MESSDFCLNLEDTFPIALTVFAEVKKVGSATPRTNYHPICLARAATSQCQAAPAVAPVCHQGI